MRKTSLLLLLFCICNANCTQHQREGWAKRFENLSGDQEQTEQKDTLNQNHFTISKDKQELIGLETAIVQKTTIDDILELPAEIVSNPNNVVSIYAPISGKIISLSAALGSVIEKNVLIASIENPQNLGQRYEVRSPMHGVVTLRPSNIGEWIEAGKQIIEITDYSGLQGLIRFYPDDQYKIKVGQAVQLETGGTKMKGKITLISPIIDPATRTIAGRVDIPNSDPTVKANAYATAFIFIGKKEGIIIPTSALLNEETRHIVFVQQGNNFEKRFVETGIRNGELIEILNGLQEGDVVVTKGAYQLKNINFSSNPSEE